jgi:hypothetical protein
MAAAFPLGRRASGGYYTDRTRNGHGATLEPSAGLGNPGGGSAARKTPAANTLIRNFVEQVARSARGTGNGGTGDRSIHQFGFYKCLQKSCFLETEETLADDDVIQEMDLKNLRSRRDALSEL